ncbi:hypothetical protein GIB67_031470, partial [Kingdonia uniflora]
MSYEKLQSKGQIQSGSNPIEHLSSSLLFDTCREENHSVGAKIIFGDAENHEDEKIIDGNIVIDLSPRSKQSGDEEGFLLPDYVDVRLFVILYYVVCPFCISILSILCNDHF